VKVLDDATSCLNITTIDQHASGTFIPYIKKHIDTSKRADVLYCKESTREKRGKGRWKVGIRSQVTGLISCTTL
jgi:hypothetical protein